MSSASGSGNESDRSASPVNNGPAPTPGHRLSRSASNSPARSRSGTPASGNRSRSGSPSSNKSGGTQKSGGSRKSRSRSVASNASNRSRSPASHRTGSGSHRSSSAGSGKSQSRSGSAASSKSGSRSGSAASKKSGSRSRSGSAASKKSGSRSGSAASKKSGSRSRSGSAASQKSGSRSGSAASNRSGTPESRQSRSRSGSAASNRSRSVASNRSGTRSRSQSPTKPPEPQERSRSNSPNLHIDESGSPQNDRGDNRLRDSSEERTIKKKNRKITSDSEEDEDNIQTGKEVSAAAIFGDDADDISSEDDKDEKGRESDKDGRRSDDERRSDEEHEQREGEEDEGKENEPEPIPETRIDVEIPKISCDLGRDIHFVKLPNFLSVDTRPFDPETYEDEIDEEETLDEEGRARLKLKVENTIRWREIADKEGNTQKQSNARLVRWSDGSYSLHLGSEIFDVYKQPLQGDHNHLFIRQGTGLQGQAVFRTKLSFRPHSTESFTHRKMTLSLADRSQKTSGIKILSQVGADPDQDRKMLLKKEEEKLRQTVRVSKPRRKGDPARSHSTAYREEEGSDEEGAISLNAIKNKYKSGAAMAAKGGAIYSSDEDGSDIETRGKKRDKAKVSKVLRDSDSNEESE